MEIILIDFTHVNSEEKELIRKWRSDDRINKWMLHQEKISKEKHGNFIEKLKKNHKNKYWLVKDKAPGNYLGVIYLNKIDVEKKTAEFGLYVNPSLIGKGIGKILLDELKRIARHKYHLGKLRLEVLNNNIRAANLYKKNGFIIDSSVNDTIYINNKEYGVVRMYIDLI